MDEDLNAALNNTNEVSKNNDLYIQEKSLRMNELFNKEIPYFRCSD